MAALQCVFYTTLLYPPLFLLPVWASKAQSKLPQKHKVIYLKNTK
jgi:hypothetical protein